MGVPFETLIPYGIIVGLFGVAGVGLSTVQHFKNEGKGPRRGLDSWDRQSRLHFYFLTGTTPENASADPAHSVMNRDLRLTGKLRGQTDNPVAPPGFELNNPWRVEPKYS